MASKCYCITCGGSKEDAETFCTFCKAAFYEIATEVDSFYEPCDSPEIEIATAENNLPVSNLDKRKREADSSCDSPEIDIATSENNLPFSNPDKRERRPTESCIVCGQDLGATPITTCCSICESALSEIASPESAMNSIPPPVHDSTRRRIQFDAAVGGVTVDLCTPKKVASPCIDSEKEAMSILARDDKNLSDQSQESTLESDCEVTEVKTVEDVIGQRFVEATQNGEIVDLVLSQEESESSEEVEFISQQPAVRPKTHERRRTRKYEIGISRHV
jgi:hypothetical protein